MISGGEGGEVEFNFLTFIIHYTLIRLYIKLSWKDIVGHGRDIKEERKHLPKI